MCYTRNKRKSNTVSSNLLPVVNFTTAVRRLCVERDHEMFALSCHSYPFLQKWHCTVNSIHFGLMLTWYNKLFWRAFLGCWDALFNIPAWWVFLCFSLSRAHFLSSFCLSCFFKTWFLSQQILTLILYFSSLFLSPPTFISISLASFSSSSIYPPVRLKNVSGRWGWLLGRQFFISVIFPELGVFSCWMIKGNYGIIMSLGGQPRHGESTREWPTNSENLVGNETFEKISLSRQIHPLWVNPLPQYRLNFQQYMWT